MSVDPARREALKRDAWRRLAAQRRHVGILRGRVVATSMICFALLWGIVFAQMATGHDPVLSGKEKTIAAQSPRAGEEQVETTDPRELEPEPELREPETEAELEFQEPEAEFEEVEPEFVEPEPEPLETAQS